MGVADYKSVGDSISLAEIGAEPFTPIAVENSNYDEGNETTEGVKITTKETFEKDGNKFTKLHTTRVAVVKFFKNEKLRQDLADGKNVGTFKCVEKKSQKTNKNYFDLEDA